MPKASLKVQAAAVALQQQIWAKTGLYHGCHENVIAHQIER
jgi:hypothetical protein